MVSRVENIIHSGELLSFNSLHFFLSQLYRATDVHKYQDIILDFSHLESGFADTIVPICSDVIRHKKNDISFKLILPTNDKTKRLFINTNWAHIIDESHPESVFSGYTQHPAVIINNEEDLHLCVNNIIDCILRATKIENRNDLHIIEWSLNEIIENIIRHAGVDAVGIVHLSRFLKNKKCVEVVISDNGMGIPHSLRSAGLFKTLEDYDIIKEATKEGVTNGSGMGNGLYGAYETSVKSGGYFKVCSLHGIIDYQSKTKILHQRPSSIPLHGTLICMALDFSVPGVLENALKIKGKVHSPTSIYTEILYDDTTLSFAMKQEVNSCSTRNIAAAFRKKVINLYNIQSPKNLIFNFEDVGIMTSSFADELFGKLILELGQEIFNEKVKIIKLTDENRVVSDRALEQRVKILTIQ